MGDIKAVDVDAIAPYGEQYAIPSGYALLTTTLRMTRSPPQNKFRELVLRSLYKARSGFYEQARAGACGLGGAHITPVCRSKQDKESEENPKELTKT